MIIIFMKNLAKIPLLIRQENTHLFIFFTNGQDIAESDKCICWNLAKVATKLDIQNPVVSKIVQESIFLVDIKSEMRWWTVDILYKIKGR